MTGSTRALAPYRPRDAAPWLVPAVLVAGLAGIVAARLLATRAGVDGVAIGAGFGLALGGLALWGANPRPARVRRWIERRRAPRRMVVAIAAGGAFGLVLVALAVLGPWLAGSTTVPGLGRPAAPFLSWLAVTVLVATTEEVLLRGILFDRIGRAGGVVLAIVLTSAVFALMHVPLYGWHVVPLDFAVGLGLAGLRLTTRGLLAPALAHSIADLATWWL